MFPKLSPDSEKKYYFQLASTSSAVLENILDIPSNSLPRMDSCSLLPRNQGEFSESGLLCYFQTSLCPYQYLNPELWKIQSDGEVELDGYKWTVLLQHISKEVAVVSSSQDYILSSEKTNNTFTLDSPAFLEYQRIERLKFTSVSVERRLEKQGMHREIITKIRRNEPLESYYLDDKVYCSTHIVNLLGEDVFVDRYEVEELARFGGPNITIFRDIDLEKPSYLSPQNLVIVTSNNEGKWQSESSLPIHLRYQRPSYLQQFIPVSILPSLVLTHCGRHSYPKLPNAWISCLLFGDEISVPSSELLLIHTAHPIQVLETVYPTGQWNDEQLVKVVTYTVTSLLSLLTISVIVYKNPSESVGISKSKNKR